MAARTQSPIFSIVGLGLSAFAIHSLMSKRKFGRFGYGQGPGPTIFDPRPQGGDAPSLEDDEADSEEDDEGDDGEDGETEDEETRRRASHLFRVALLIQTTLHHRLKAGLSLGFQGIRHRTRKAPMFPLEGFSLASLKDPKEGGP